MKFIKVLILFSVLLSFSAKALLEVNIIKSKEDAFPLVITPFEMIGNFEEDVDLARIIKKVIVDDIVECFNVAPPNQNYSINKMARLSMEALEVNIPIKYDSTKPDGQYNKEISTSKLVELFPDFKFMGFKEGVRKASGGLDT